MKTRVELKLQYPEIQMSSQAYFLARERSLVIEMIFWKKIGKNTGCHIFGTSN